MHEVYIDGVKYVSAPTPIPVEPGDRRWYSALEVLERTNPTGAWGRLNGGRAASKTEVDYNAARLPPEPYLSNVRTIATKFSLPPQLLMGIFDRESNHGRALDKNGYGDKGNGFGVGQVDKRYHTQQGKPDPYSIEHLNQCAEIFTQYLVEVQQKHPGWGDKHVLKGAVVAYNSGVSNVQTIEGMDKGTTGNDYGADTCARAQFWGELL